MKNSGKFYEQKIALKWAVGLITLTSTLQVSHASSMSEFIWKSVVPAFETSPAYQALIQSKLAASDAEAREVLQSPWTVGVEATRSQFSESPVRGLDYGRAESLAVSPVLQYAIRQGWDASLSGSWARYSLFEPNVLSQGSTSSKTWSLELGYELMRGGSLGFSESQARSSAAGYKRSQAQSESQILSARIRYVQELINIYLVECRIQQTTSAQASVNEAIESGRVQLKVKSISRRDYLNFLDLGNSLARRIANEEASRSVSLERVSAYGETTLALALQLRKQARCAPDIQDVLKRAESFGDLGKKASTWAVRLPSASAARYRQEAANLTLRASRISNLPSFRPYVSGGMTTQETQNFSTRTFAVGVQLEWNIPLKKGHYGVESSRNDERAAVSELKAAILENTAQILSVKAQVDAQARVSTILNQSLENSSELLRFLQVQKRIGSIDSVNFANAYLNQVDAAVALIDSWGSLEHSVYELTEYQRLQGQ